VLPALYDPVLNPEDHEGAAFRQLLVPLAAVIFLPFPGNVPKRLWLSLGGPLRGALP
jgi:hypothetical protein